jgi:hypothetical protein
VKGLAREEPERCRTGLAFGTRRLAIKGGLRSPSPSMGRELAVWWYRWYNYLDSLVAFEQKSLMAIVPHSYESLRHGRRYEVDARGIAEFGTDRALRGFIPWCAVGRIEFTHSRAHRVVRWSVRSADGSGITPSLEYTNSLECYHATLMEWRATIPHAFRAHFMRVYRRFRRAHALLHLMWVIPAVLIYGLVALSYVLHVDTGREELMRAGIPIAIVYALCVTQNLLCLKELRLGFDEWFARMEASLIKPENAPRASSSAILRWMFPSVDDASTDQPITDEEHSVYRRWEIGGALSLFPLVALLCFGWYLVLTSAANLFYHDLPGTRFVVRPAAYYWMLPALVLGIITSPIPLDWLYRVLLRDRYRRFHRFSLERAGFDARRLFVFLAVIILTASAVFFVAGVTSFCRFTDAGIEIQRPFSFHSAFYSYARVRAIEHHSSMRMPAGNTIKRPNHVIIFDDSTSWSSADGLRDPSPEVDSRIARFVSGRTGLSIVEQP